MKTILALSLLALVYPTGVSAQSPAGFGAVTGRIRDQGGDGIPDTTVVLSNEAMGVRRTMTTSDDGVFEAPALLPSNGYRLKATRKGFVDWEYNGFDVSVGQTLNFKIEMQIEGTPTTEAENAKALAAVDDTRVGVSTLVTRSQIDGLPTSLHRLDELVLLAPMVSPGSAPGEMAFRSVPSSNSFLTDGLVTTNTFYLGRPGIANQLSPDAVEGVQVLAAVAPTEFGRAMGGIVNAATRSGGNRVHGAAYDYLANPSLSASGRYALGHNLLQKQNQAGGSVGGPIFHDKLFFFANAEVLSGRFQDLNRITSPLIADPTGTSAPLSNCKASVALCTAAIQFIQPQMNAVTPLSQRWASGLAKIDYRRSDRNTFGVEANAMDSRFPDGAQTENVAPNGGLLGIGISEQQTRYAKAAWTSVPTPFTVNEARFGLFQDRLSDPASQSTRYGGLAISVAGATVGGAHPYNSLVKEQRYQLVDNFTWTSYAHSLRFGADLSTTRDSIDELANSSGSYFYPSLTAFAQDLGSLNQKNYTAFTQAFGNSSRAFSTREINVYAQDTWKVFRNLTVTYGVRWEKSLLPKPAESNSIYLQTGVIPSRNLNFAPRASIAYLLDYRTVVRFSYGWYYAPHPGSVLDALFLGNAVYQTNVVVNPTQSGAPVFPNVFSSVSSIPSGTENVLYATSKWRNPYSQQATFAFERRVSRDTALTVNLIHSPGAKLLTASDTNLTAPTKAAIYTIDNASNQAAGTFTTQVWTAKNTGSYAHVYEVGNGGSSWYDAVAVQVRKQMLRTLSVQASYTWSHAIDDVSGPPVVAGVPLNTSDTYYTDDKGNSPTDQRHRAAINWLWQPKVVKSNAPAARFLLNGWELSAIATLASPRGATPVVLVSGQQISGITMLYTNSLNGSGGWNRAPYQKMNGLYTDPQYNVNARVTRTLPFSERVKGMLMFEAFNVFNSHYITGVNTVFYTAAAGVLKPATGVGAGNASDGFPGGASARRCQVAFRLEF